MAAGMADKTGDERFPCLNAEPVSVRALTATNRGRWNQYTYNVSKSLARRKILMPLVVRRSDLRVVNGIGRLQWYAAEKMASAPAVLLSDEEAALADAIANLPERERLVLALYYDEELNLKEIGEVLGVSESRVSQLHSQCAARLRGRLGEWRAR